MDSVNFDKTLRVCSTLGNFIDDEDELCPKDNISHVADKPEQVMKEIHKCRRFGKTLRVYCILD